MSRRAHLSSWAALFLAGSVVATGLGPDPSTAAARHDVIARTFEFSPRDLTIDPGDTVRWVWESGTHTVTEGTDCTVDTPLFNANLVPATPTFRYVFQSPGRVDYFCVPHCVIMNMKGSVTVRPTVPERFFRNQLDGDQMVPPVDTEAFGHVQAYLSSGGDRLHIQIVVENLTNQMTASHIHLGAPGVNGPMIFELGVFQDSLAADINVPPNIRGPLRDGNMYVAVHTAPYPAGELRGQLDVTSAFTLEAALNGTAAGHPTSPAVGYSEITLWDDLSRTHIDLSTNGLHSAITAAHVHQGTPGQVGPIVWNLGSFSGRVVRDFGTTPAQAAALQSGAYYLDVHTAEFPDGEIRGQIEVQTAADVPPSAPPEPPMIGIHVLPTPTRGPIEAHLSLPEAAEIQVRLIAPDGREVRRWTEPGRAGHNLLSWNGRFADGTVAPTGSYILSLRAGDVRGTARVVVLR